MISIRDVLLLKVPFPNISSGLANKKHMYICMNKDSSKREFVKCQSLKPSMLYNSPTKYHIDEVPNINRNPFNKKTRIDCDKKFISINVKYDTILLTSNRRDICAELFTSLISMLRTYTPKSISMNNSDLKNLNNVGGVFVTDI